MLIVVLRGVLPLPLLLSDSCASDRAEPLVLSEPAATFSRLIEERGTFTYASRSYTSAGVPERSESIHGLVVMRNPAEMRAVGGDYYDDGFGNLVRFGAFRAPALGGDSRYALTFRCGGALQLALDLRNDAVVDVAVELGVDGRLGAFGLRRPALESVGGTRPATPTCLPE